MYFCSICNKSVLVDHITPPKCCNGAKIYAGMSGSAIGHGGLVANVANINNNLSDESAEVVKQVMTYLIATEVFKNGKQEIYAKDVEIIDSITSRKFKFNITVKEC